MKESIDFVELILTIMPFIFGVIALTLIPSKKKISGDQPRNFKVEVLILVYLIALLILMLGLYYFLPAFGDDPGEHLTNIFNGVLMSVVGLGIMVINYKNYSFYSELHSDENFDDRVPGTDGYSHSEDIIEVASVEVIEKPTKAMSITRPEPELLECPQCTKTITITATKRPLKIKCPHCGVEGIIR